MTRVDTTFDMDFAIADRFGVNAVKDTFNRAFNEWKSDARYLTELVMVLNHRCWYWYHLNKHALSKVYEDLFYKAHHYAVNHLKGKELAFYLDVTD